ncbi:hypothetical protein [Roseimicrobium sp. ORNL1]|uniref:hypothetical protein n=1 Tax=Roseimicrobium sp. ORNL1 TaxID=2711231 RepID=UPI0013E16D42|nr:hypothetical protein [Roseimicrobium sp. ORNL1]QIF00725.1 hypothetical protein G5S37_04040 [Roseimicrobium sp. ORNL1]
MDREIEIARFFHREPATVCGKVLQEAGISFRLSDDSLTPDVSALGRSSNPACLVLIPESAEIQAREALLENARKEALGEVDPSHPMTTWSDEDLTKTLAEPSEWSPYEIAVAEKLLRDRGREVAPVRYFATNRKAPAQERAPEGPASHQEPLPGLKAANSLMTIFGFVSSTAGGLIGLIIASSYVFSTDQLPDGQKRWTYDPKSRVVGAVMFTYAVIMFCLFIGWGLQNRLARR